MSLVTQDDRGLVIEGTVVKSNGQTLQVGTEEEMRLEEKGRDEPVKALAEIAALDLEGKRVQIVVKELL